MFGLTHIPQTVLFRVVAVLVWSVLCFGGGYLYKGHRVQVAEAAKTATQETAQVTAEAGAKASDSVSIASLKSKLDSADSWAKTLQARLKDQSNASPSADICRLPDGLRNQINDSFASRP